jgi:hypothetical protein
MQAIRELFGDWSRYDIIDAGANAAQVRGFAKNG